MEKSGSKKGFGSWIAFYRQRTREARKLYKRSGGVLLVFLAVFALLQSYILNPLGRVICNAVMQTVPGGYITDGTAGALLRCPQVLVIGVLLLACRCIIIVWKLSGILLCLEYHEQGKNVRLIHLIPESFRNILHLLHPRNWLFFLYTIILLPLVSLYDAIGFQSELRIPEYISDYIYSNDLLTIILIAAYIVTAFFVLRWFFVLQGCLLKRMSFAESARESARLTKGKRIFHLIVTVVFQFFQMIRTEIVPGLIAIVVFSVTMYIERNNAGMFASARFFYLESAVPVIRNLASMFIQMASMCFLLSCYRNALQENGMETEIHLPDSGVKFKGRIWKFRGLRPACFILVIAGYGLLYMIFTELLQTDPELIGILETDTQIAAHKGYSSEAPENTIPAFEKAVSCGCADMIELDVRETSDGIPVVIHNASLKSAIGIDKPVYEMTYDELRQYTASYDYEPSEFPDAYIPTLEEVLQKYADKIPLIIEIKASPLTPELPAKIVSLMQKYNCTDTCVIHSGSYASLEDVKKIDPSIKCGYIVALSIGNYYNLPCADFFSVEHNFVNYSMLSDIHDLGKEVYVWTVNEEHSIDEMKDIGVDVIITDVPETVSESIHENDDDILDFWQETLSDGDEPDADENSGEGLQTSEDY